QRSDAIDRALRVIRTRIDELGVAEPGIQKAGNERIVVELPGAGREAQQRAKDVIQRSAFLQFQIVQPISELAGALPRIDRAVLAAGVEVEAPVAAQPEQPAAPSLGLFEAAEDSAAAEAEADS